MCGFNYEYGDYEDDFISIYTDSITVVVCYGVKFYFSLVQFICDLFVGMICAQMNGFRDLRYVLVHLRSANIDKSVPVRLLCGLDDILSLTLIGSFFLI